VWAATSPARRVLIIDLDVHFCGGTAEIVRGGVPLDMDDAGAHVLRAIHLVDVYDARGQELRSRARRAGRAWDVVECTENVTCVNVALLDPAAGDDVYLGAVVQGAIAAAFEAHAPDLVLVSLGLDAAAGDYEGFGVTPSGYRGLLRAIGALCGARHAGLVVALEGGYECGAIGAGIAECMRACCARDALRVELGCGGSRAVMLSPIPWGSCGFREHRLNCSTRRYCLPHPQHVTLRRAHAHRAAARTRARRPRAARTHTATK
jgi:acetoin utilization deacetylase AcuC-like enzyme